MLEKMQQRFTCKATVSGMLSSCSVDALSQNQSRKSVKRPTLPLLAYRCMAGRFSVASSNEHSANPSRSSCLDRGAAVW
jgi:hypothetical protein